MPTYVYQIINDDGSEGDYFEVVQKMSDEPLTKHAETGAAVRRVPQAPIIPGHYSDHATKQMLRDKNLDDPDFERLYARTIERVQAHDVAVGCYAATADAARRLLDMGVGVITINVDGAMLRRSYETALEQLPGRG